MGTIKSIIHNKDLRKRILITIAILIVYRIGAYIPIPGIPATAIMNEYKNSAVSQNALSVLNLFSGGALSRMSVFCLGIMPYITAQIIIQLLQAVLPSLRKLQQEGEPGQRKIIQYTRYATILLALINAIGYLFLFTSSSFGVTFTKSGVPVWMMNVMVVGTMLIGAMIVMWLGEIITQKGCGNGMSLIIFANIIASIPTALINAIGGMDESLVISIVVIAVVIVVIPFIVYLERGQRRIPIQYTKRVVARGAYAAGGNSYLPIKLNTAGVIPIIFASTLLYLPSQIAVFFPNTQWLTNVASALSSGWVNWILTAVLIIAFAYFYTAIVFNPDQTADSLRKQGAFIPGVRPGANTSSFVHDISLYTTLPAAIFVAIIAVVPSIVLAMTGNSLLQSFGGTSILIMVGVILDTQAQIEGYVKTSEYDNATVAAAA